MYECYFTFRSITAAQRAGRVAVGDVFVPPFLLEEVEGPIPPPMCLL